jgi:hypothetical protein
MGDLQIKNSLNTMLLCGVQVLAAVPYIHQSRFKSLPVRSGADFDPAKDSTQLKSALDSPRRGANLPTRSSAIWYVSMMVVVIKLGN